MNGSTIALNAEGDEAMTIIGKDWVYVNDKDDHDMVELHDLGSDELLQLALDLTNSLNEVLNRLFKVQKEGKE